MLLLLLEGAEAPSVPMPTFPPGTPAWIIAMALVALALAVGAWSLSPLIRQLAAERRMAGLEARGELREPTGSHAAIVATEEKLAKSLMEHLRKEHGDELEAFFRHHKRIYFSLLGERIDGSDGVVLRVIRMSELLEDMGKGVDELVKDLEKRQAISDRDLRAAVRKIGGGTDGQDR